MVDSLKPLARFMGGCQKTLLRSCNIFQLVKLRKSGMVKLCNKKRQKQREIARNMLPTINKLCMLQKCHNEESMLRIMLIGFC